jgi:hypothetical protein
VATGAQLARTTETRRKPENASEAERGEQILLHAVLESV